MDALDADCPRCAKFGAAPPVVSRAPASAPVAGGVTCPHCGKRVTIPAAVTASVLKCPACKKMFRRDGKKTVSGPWVYPVAIVMAVSLWVWADGVFHPGGHPAPSTDTYNGTDNSTIEKADGDTAQMKAALQSIPGCNDFFTGTVAVPRNAPYLARIEVKEAWFALSYHQRFEMAQSLFRTWETVHKPYRSSISICDDHMNEVGGGLSYDDVWVQKD